MGIRGKLNIGLSLLIIVSISAFALITQMTVNDSVTSNRDDVFSQKASKLSIELRNLLRDNINAMERFFLQDDHTKHLIEDYPSWGTSEKQLVKEHFLAQLVSNVLISSITLIDPNGNPVLEQGRYKGPLSNKFKSGSKIDGEDKCPCEPQIMSDLDYVYLLYPFGSKHTVFVRGVLVYQIRISTLAESLSHNHEMADHAFYITSNKVPIYEYKSSQDKSFANFTTGIFVNSLKENIQHYMLPPKMEIDDYFIFSSSYEPLRWNLSYIIPSNIYHAGLVDLRNRLIIALAIIVWLAVDIIFIFSYRITKPLTHLSKITKDMIFYDYDSHLEFVNTKDEIGELYSSFEAMRQKVKLLTTTDALTGVLNRRFFMINLEKEYERLKRSGGDLCCLMLDIDNFKKVNDTWGHQCGDAVLIRLGSLMMGIGRTYDILARYGGEEFIIALPHTSLEDARIFAERLRKSVEGHTIVFDNTKLSVTISMGISCFSNLASDTPDLLIKRADSALYTAKRTGKNKVVIYEKDLEPA